MNQYTDIGGTAYTFDADGNMTSRTEGGITITYTYDIENRLIALTPPTETWTYTYDGLGNRIVSDHNCVATNYVVDPIGFGNVAAEYDDSGGLISQYDHGHGLLARTDTTGVSAYYTFDAIGSTSEITGTTGNTLNTYAYDPFGVSLRKSDIIPSQFQYVGEYGVMNENNGLDFMRARYYDAAIGRFMTEDPLGHGGGV